MAHELIDDELLEHLDAAVRHVDDHDPFRSIEELMHALTSLGEFMSDEDRNLRALMNTLSEGGIFSRDVSSALERNFAQVRALHEKITKADSAISPTPPMLKEIHDGLVSSYETKVSVIHLFEKEHDTASRLCVSLRSYLVNERKILELITAYQQAVARRGGRLKILAGDANHLSTIVQGSINDTKVLFEAIESALLTRLKESMQSYLRAEKGMEDLLSAGEAQAHTLPDYKVLVDSERVLLERLSHEHQRALSVIREAAIQLRQSRRSLQREARDIAHFISFLALVLKRIEREGKWQ